MCTQITITTFTCANRACYKSVGQPETEEANMRGRGIYDGRGKYHSCPEEQYDHGCREGTVRKTQRYALYLRRDDRVDCGRVRLNRSPSRGLTFCDPCRKDIRLKLAAEAAGILE
jgi:hypothetical protein